MVIRIFKIVYRFHIIYGATLLVTSVLLLPERVFPYMTMGGLWTALGQQGEQSGKRPRHGVEENEDKLPSTSTSVHHCIFLPKPSKVLTTTLPVLSQSYVRFSFNSNSELYWEGGDRKHISQINPLVNRTSARLLKVLLGLGNHVIKRTGLWNWRYNHSRMNKRGLKRGMKYCKHCWKEEIYFMSIHPSNSLSFLIYEIYQYFYWLKIPSHLF